jgi:hypothetical protein
MAFDETLKIWDASCEADFDGWKLWMVENLNNGQKDRAYLITIRRDKDSRQVYVNKPLGETMHRRFVKQLENEWIQTVCQDRQF